MQSKHLIASTVVAVLLAFGSCKTQRITSPHTSFPEFSFEGHRGARGLYPENTIHGMYKALDLGVTTLEMDAHITKDKQVVLSHDAYLNPKFVRTAAGKDLTDRNHLIYQLDYTTLKKFDVGTKEHVDFPQQQSTKEYIPLLSDLIDSVENYVQTKELQPIFFNIETKSNENNDGKHHPDPKTFVDLLIGVIDQKKISDRVVIQSFDPRTLQVLHKDYPNIRTSLLVGDNKKSVQQHIEDLGFIPFIYSPNFKLVDENLVRECHQLGMKVIPWTANTSEDISSLKSLNVDGIISDYPNLFNLPLRKKK